MVDQQDPARLRPAVFLDRDGVLNVDAGYTHKVEDLQLYADVVSSLTQLQMAGYKLIVISNQSGVGRGMFSEDDVQRFHAAMEAELLKAGIAISGFYYCPHAPETHCDCRKPKTALVEQAIAEHQIHRAMSWFVGDKDSDVECGLNAGLQPVHVNRRTGEDHPRALAVKSLSELPQIVLKKKSRFTEGLMFLALCLMFLTIIARPWNTMGALAVTGVLIWHAPQWGLPRLYQFRSWLWFPWSKIPWRPLLYCLLMGVFVWSISYVSLTPWRIWAPEELLDSVLAWRHMLTPAGFALTTIAVPLLEEILFRGVLFLWLLRRLNVMPAIAISSLFFGILHGEAIIASTLFGVVMCVAYLQTGSLIPSILLHALNNIVGWLTIYFEEPWTLAAVQTFTVREFVPDMILFVVSIPGILWIRKCLASYRNVAFRSTSSY